MGRFAFIMEHHQQRRCMNLPEHLLDRSLVQALPSLHAFSGCDTTSCFKGKGTLKKYIFSERGFACHFKLCPTKTVLIDKINVQMTKAK